MPANANSAESDFRFVYAAWVVATLGMLMSAFFSEVMKLPPCTLCWYQRICLFPLVAIFAVGIVRRDAAVVSYALPLVLIGLGISIYHNLLYYGVIPEALSPCSEGVSCTEVQLEWLGFITIPMLALAGFVTVLGSLLAHLRSAKRSNA
jgi:disulfide bond formation protein DsbB